MEDMQELLLYMGVGVYLCCKYWSTHVLPFLQETWLVLLLLGFVWLLHAAWFRRLLAWPFVLAYRGLCLAAGWRR